MRDPLANPEPLIERVYSYVAYRIGAGPDAEDVTNDVFERALRFRGGYDASKGEPVAWLLGIARRCIVDRVRPEAGAIDAADVGTTEDIATAAVRRLTVGDAVARLPERDRDLVALRYGADLSAKQIASVLGMRTNAVEVALHRALARLRTELGGEAGPGRETAALQPVRI